MTPEDPNNYTVKEILTQFVMPALNDLRTQQELKTKEDNTRFEKLEAAKNRAYGGLILLTAVIIPISIPVISAAVH